MDEVTRLYDRWREALPTVQPYYAVKCNSDEHLLAHLADLGVFFDCASPAEMDLVLKYGGVSPVEILYANPQKLKEDLALAVERGVSRTTVDSIYEIDKLADVAPGMECLIRFYANDPTAQCPLSNKFGAMPDEWEALLERARDRGVPVVGMSFHVGSGAKSPKAFQMAIRNAQRLYVLGKRYGFALNLLDIGGGFVAETFETFASTIRSTLADAGFLRAPFTVIAEPGRYFAETVATLFTQVTGRRDRGDARHYYLTDSIYGSFNALMYDHMVPTPVPFRSEQSDESAPPSPTALYPSTLFGATCDGLDTIVEHAMLPELKVGDWIQWPKMGAYTTTGASLFNGFGFPFIPKFYL